jgi:hypothetical protein
MSRGATRHRPGRRIVLAALAGVWVTWASASRAGDIFTHDQNVAVLDRPHPEYDPIGIRAGAFEIYPKVLGDVSYDDNVFATPADPLGDALFKVEPGVTIKSDWNQNAFSLEANGVLRRYATYGLQNSDEYSVTGAGVLDVRHDLTVTTGASHARVLLTRDTDAYATDSLTPLLYDVTTTRLGVVKTFNRLKLTAGGVFEDYRYHDGLTRNLTPLDATFRDRDTFAGSLRADYALSGNVALFAQETVTHSTYNRTKFRNHDQTETLVGPSFVLTHLISAEIGVGYLTSDFADPAARSVGNFTARAKIEYFPTELITVTLTADQAVIDSGLPTSPAYLSRASDLEADYELLRNLIISAKVGAIWNRYEVIDRYDRDFNASLAATWRINRGLDFGLGYNRLQRGSSGAAAGRRFDDDVVSLSVTVLR